MYISATFPNILARFYISSVRERGNIGIYVLVYKNVHISSANMLIVLLSFEKGQKNAILLVFLKNLKPIPYLYFSITSSAKLIGSFLPWHNISSLDFFLEGSLVLIAYLEKVIPKLLAFCLYNILVLKSTHSCWLVFFIRFSINDNDL